MIDSELLAQHINVLADADNKRIPITISMKYAF